jgi:hypothetical protein
MAAFLPVISSKLASMKYERDRSRLVVQFGEVYYEYDGVPGEVVLDVLFSDSIGKAFHTLVEGGGFAYRRVAADKALA